MDSERVTRLFEADRSERLDALEKYSNEELVSMISSEEVVTPTVVALLSKLKQMSDAEAAIDRAFALLNDANASLRLGLPPPKDIQLPSHSRARVKKARTRLRGIVSTFLSTVKDVADEPIDATPWQKGIVDGNVDLPVWSVSEREAELAAREASTPAETVAKKVKKS